MKNVARASNAQNRETKVEALAEEYKRLSDMDKRFIQGYMECILGHRSIPTPPEASPSPA